MLTKMLNASTGFLTISHVNYTFSCIIGTFAEKLISLSFVGIPYFYDY